jgi:hypothetical protein
VRTLLGSLERILCRCGIDPLHLRKIKSEPVLALVVLLALPDARIVAPPELFVSLCGGRGGIALVEPDVPSSVGLGGEAPAGGVGCAEWTGWRVGRGSCHLVGRESEGIRGEAEEGERLRDGKESEEEKERWGRSTFTSSFDF